MEYCEDNVSECVFKMIISDEFQVPNSLRIDHERVAELKSMLQSTPDKTQTFLGLVCATNEDDDRTSPFWVYVNVEMFIAMKELYNEGRRGNKKILSAVHFVGENDPICLETFGMFLHTNAQVFSAKLHKLLKYQDVLRFCVSTLTNECDKETEDVEDFLRRTLKGFAKGAQNITTFLKFGALDLDYLNSFENFLHLFETGALPGQKLSIRKMMNIDKKGKRRKDGLIEVPIGFLKLHLKVPQKTREELLESIMNKKIEIGDYRNKMISAASISDRKKQVEEISKKPFADVMKAAPEMFTDERLMEFDGAKIGPKGQNDKHVKLANHVKSALGKGRKGAPSEETIYIASDNLNMHSLGRVFKDYSVVVINHKDESGAEDFCLTEKIKDEENCAGVIIKSENSLRSQMEGMFSDEDDIMVNYVYYKMEKPVMKDGFKIEITPLAVFGNKKYFENKEIKNFYNSPLKQALQLLLKDMLESKQSVLYSFDGSHGLDVDNLGSLRRKCVKLSYMAKDEDLSVLKAKIGKRIV